MNKLFIVFLAVCLVSVHAFVKRDAPEDKPKDDIVEKILESGKNIAKTIEDSLKEAFDKEKLQQQFNSGVEGLKKAFDSSAQSLKAISKDGAPAA